MQNRVEVMVSGLENAEEFLRIFNQDKDRLEDKINMFDEQIKFNEKKIGGLSEECHKQKQKVSDFQKILSNSYDYQSENEKLLRVKDFKEDALFGLREQLTNDFLEMKEKYSNFQKSIGQKHQDGRSLLRKYNKLIQKQSGGIKKLTLLISSLRASNRSLSERHVHISNQLKSQNSLVLSLQKKLQENSNKYEEKIHKIKMDYEDRILQINSKLTGSNNHKVEMLKKRLIQQKVDSELALRKIKDGM